MIRWNGFYGETKRYGPIHVYGALRQRGGVPAAFQGAA